MTSLNTRKSKPIYCCIIPFAVVIYIVFVIYTFMEAGDLSSRQRPLTKSFNKFKVNENTENGEKDNIKGNSDSSNNIFEGYPQYTSLLDILRNWNPDNPDVPETFKETILSFNYSDPKERELAAKYRDAELPFKVYNVPEINKVSMKWTDEYLIRNLERHVHVEHAADNHFMFYKMTKLHKQYQPPTKAVMLPFKTWLEKAKEADVHRIDNRIEHFYLTIGTSSRKDRAFYSQDLGIFSTEKNNFFITNVDKNKGIQL